MKTASTVLWAVILAGAAFYSGFYAGQAYQDDKSWQEGRKIMGQYYVGGDLRGWSTIFVDIKEEFYKQVNKEIGVLEKRRPLNSYSWVYASGLDRKTKEPVILVMIQENNESDKDIIIDAIPMTRLLWSIDSFRLRHGGYIHRKFIKDAIGDDAKITAQKLYDHISQNFK